MIASVVPLNMNDKLADIRNTGMELAINERQRSVCPWCGGGSGNDAGSKTLSISRAPGVISYMCFRASCHAHGSFNVNNLVQENKVAAAPPKKDLRAKMHFEVLSQAQREWLHQRFYLEDEDIRGWYWVKNMGRMWIPMYDMFHAIIGGNARSFASGSKFPKAIVVQTDLDKPKASWYRHRATEELSLSIAAKTLWIFEDQISAIRASKYVDSVALLGSHIPEMLITAIKAAQYEHVVIALDKDAYAMSINYRNKYAELFKSVKVAQLQKDAKNMTPTELEAFIVNGEIKGAGLE